MAPLDGGSAAETASLLVSELVSNVVLHARTACEVTLECDGGVIRFAVRDFSERLPRSFPDAELVMGNASLGVVTGLAHAAAL